MSIDVPSDARDCQIRRDWSLMFPHVYIEETEDNDQLSSSEEHKRFCVLPSSSEHFFALVCDEIEFRCEACQSFAVLVVLV